VTRLLAIDHGSRRIGVALADSETRIAFARPALRRHRSSGDAARIADLARGERVQRIIVGLPLNMDGSEGAQAAAARSFGGELTAIGLEVVFVDERLSSWAARQQMAAAGKRPTRQSGELDSAAAALILQQYLDTEESL
jgi:putative Holliday junction resolvase